MYHPKSTISARPHFQHLSEEYLKLTDRYKRRMLNHVPEMFWTIVSCIVKLRCNFSFLCVCVCVRAFFFRFLTPCFVFCFFSVWITTSRLLNVLYRHFRQEKPHGFVCRAAVFTPKFFKPHVILVVLLWFDLIFSLKRALTDFVDSDYYNLYDISLLMQQRIIFIMYSPSHFSRGLNQMYCKWSNTHMFVPFSYQANWQCQER